MQNQGILGEPGNAVYEWVSASEGSFSTKKYFFHNDMSKLLSGKTGVEKRVPTGMPTLSFCSMFPCKFLTWHKTYSMQQNPVARRMQAV